MTGDEFFEDIEDFLGSGIELNYLGVLEHPNAMGYPVPVGYHIYSYGFRDEVRLGSDRFIAVHWAGKQPFLLFSMGE